MIEKLFTLVKTMFPDLDKQPLAQQSQGPYAIVRILTDWFRMKKQSVILLDGESELVLMFKEIDGNLLMIPCVLNDEENPRLVRGLLEHSINVTELAQRIPVMDMLPALVAASKEKEGTPEQKAATDLKLGQRILQELRKAANHPDCRLWVAPTEETPEVKAHAESMLNEMQTPNVDALGEVEDDEDDEEWLRVDELAEEEDEDEEYEEEEEDEESTSDAGEFDEDGKEFFAASDAVPETINEIYLKYKESHGYRTLVFQSPLVENLLVPLQCSILEAKKLANEYVRSALFYARPAFGSQTGAANEVAANHQTHSH